MSAPQTIWIDWKRANNSFLAYDEAPHNPLAECRDQYTRTDIHAEIERLTKDRDEAVRCALMRRDRLDIAEAEIAMLRSVVEKHCEVKP